MPGRARTNVIDTTHLTSQLDIVPTVCDYLGVDAPPKQRGRSLRPLMEGKNVTWREFVVAANGAPARMLRTNRFKYVAYQGDPVEQLFDMRADPGETKGLAADAQHADELKALRKLLADWEARLDLAPSLPEKAIWRRA